MLELRKWVFLMVATLLLSACAAPTQVQSNKAEFYTAEPKRIFIVTDIGHEFGQEFFSAFAQKFNAIVSNCGADSQISTISSLELDESIHEKKMEAFGADTALSVKIKGVTSTQNTKVIINVIYDARLVDLNTKKMVWRANFNFYRGGTAIPIAKRGEALAIDITNKMKEDKIFQSCSVIKD